MKAKCSSLWTAMATLGGAALCGLLYSCWRNSPERQRERDLSRTLNIAAVFDADVDDFYWNCGRMPSSVSELAAWARKHGLARWRGEVARFRLSRTDGARVSSERKSTAGYVVTLRSPGGRWEDWDETVPWAVKGVAWESHRRLLEATGGELDPCFESVVSDVGEQIVRRWGAPEYYAKNGIVASVLRGGELVPLVKRWRLHVKVVEQPPPGYAVITSDGDSRELRFPLDGGSARVILHTGPSASAPPLRAKASHAGSAKYEPRAN